MEPIWLRSYPPGMPRQIDPHEIGTVPALFRDTAAAHPERGAFHGQGRTLTYRELDELSNGFSHFLLSTLELRPGDRVGLMCPNVLAYPVAMLGVLKSGLVLVNVNPFYTGSELAHQLEDSGASVLVAADMAAGALADAVPQSQVQAVVRILDGALVTPAPGGGAGTALEVDNVQEYDFEAALAQPGFSSLPEVRADDLALLQYTGGTTGRAKGAMLSHANLVASVLGFCAFLGPPPAEGTEQEVVVTATPLYHILGLCVNCLAFIHRAGMNLLIENPRDLPAMVETLRDWRFSVITGVNTLFNGLLSTPGFESLDFSGLRLAMGGGTPIQEPVSRRWHETTGHYIKEGYGMSETGGLTQTPVELAEYRSTIGLPYPSLEVSLRDEADGEVGVGEPGEICLRGPSIMRGYWNSAASSSDSFTADGFFRSGDVAVMDEDGFLRIVDRRKDVILVSGFNVYPSEVEAVASSAPGVFECACVGVPDERTGEAVRLYVVPEPKAQVSEEAILDFCRQRLTRYKLPRQVRLIDALPKTPVGKILRRELREQP